MPPDHRSSAAGLLLPTPDPGRDGAERFVSTHLLDLCLESEVVSSDRFRGGQAAADNALARFDVQGYAKNRNEAYPERARGASQLSPYIRHGLLGLGQVWDAVIDGPTTDVRRFHDELLWQEFARHWYARLGTATRQPLRRAYETQTTPTVDPSEVWDQDMACMELTTGELEEDGWLVNQTRMWLASHWTVRGRLDWRAGEDYFFRHLLDGSRAANRLGWQWTSGIGSERAYGFSRWQVERRAPGLCASCELGSQCPVDQWPDDPEVVKVPIDPLIGTDPDVDARRGPLAVKTPGESANPPDAVWVTAESLGACDPAMMANPEVPAVFVFDAPLLAKLRLSSKRLVFLTETLAEMADRRQTEIYLGSPGAVLAGRSLAATHTPVPGWQRLSNRLDLVEIHPWPWLRLPVAGSVGSFNAWIRQVDR